MGQFRYAFIVESDTMTPKEFRETHENENSYYVIGAVKSLDMACDFAIELGKEGITDIDLCGAFDGESAEKIARAAGGKIEVKYAKYRKEDQARIDELEDKSEYGIIIMDDSLSTSKWIRKTSQEFNTSIAIVGSLDSACEAAKKMLDQGTTFMGLCGWFDEDRTKKVIDAIDNALPVGTCG